MRGGRRGGGQEGQAARPHAEFVEKAEPHPPCCDDAAAATKEAAAHMPRLVPGRPRFDYTKVEEGGGST